MKLYGIRRQALRLLLEPLFPFGALSRSLSPTSNNIIKIYSNNDNNYYVRLWGLLLYNTFITVTRVVWLQGDFTVFYLGNSR